MARQFFATKGNNRGYVRFDRWRACLSEAMIGKTIEFRPEENEKTFIACSWIFEIAEFDAHTGERIRRKIRRLCHKGTVHRA